MTTNPIIFTVVRYNNATFLSINSSISRLELLGIITEAQFMISNSTDSNMSPENLSQIAITTLDLSRMDEVLNDG